MSSRMILTDVIAVVAGAVIGILVVDLLAWLFADGVFFGLVSSLGHLLVALVTVGLFAFYYRSLPPTPAALASFFTGVGLPAILERFAFDSALSWSTILFLYVLFAIAALFTYRFVHTNGAIRNAVSDTADRL